jgi:uncharacterized protein YbjT (DUF2867 family)
VILVAGGTGTLGRKIVARLLARGERVRVLTRGTRVAWPEVEVVNGDVRDPRRVEEAVRGCRAVVSALHGFAGAHQPSPEAIDRDGNQRLIAAAAEAGVEHFVLLSVHGAASDHPMSLHRAKFAAEQALARSGLAFTVIRPTAFFETWVDIITQPLAAGGDSALVFGPGVNPINFVAVQDVAALADLALRDELLRGQSLDIGGPEDLGFAALAERLLRQRGMPVRIKHIPLAALRAMAILARPFSPTFARQAQAAVVMNLTDMTFSGGRRPDYAGVPCTTLGDLNAFTR